MELRLMGGAFSNPSLSRKKKALSKNVYFVCQMQENLYMRTER